MRKCIQRLVKDELVQQYHRNSRPEEGTREVLESCGGISWREDTGEAGRKCILRLIKEEWKSVKPSVLRYHRVLRRELGEDWIQGLKTELEPNVQKLLGEGWKEGAGKYIDKLEEEDKETKLKSKEQKKRKIRN